MSKTYILHQLGNKGFNLTLTCQAAPNDLSMVSVGDGYPKANIHSRGGGGYYENKT